MSAHERVAAELRRRIFTGVYPLGARLPALWRIGEEFGVTEPVVGRAVGGLRGAGLLRSVPGVGVWVVDDITVPMHMQAALDEARAGGEPWLFYSPDAIEGGEPALVMFPAAWIQRLLDERAEVASRLAECERDDTMVGTE